MGPGDIRDPHPEEYQEKGDCQSHLSRVSFAPWGSPRAVHREGLYTKFLRNSMKHLPVCDNLRLSGSPYRSTLRSRSAFAITDTELNVMAALAIMGLSSSPNAG